MEKLFHSSKKQKYIDKLSQSAHLGNITNIAMEKFLLSQKQKTKIQKLQKKL